MMPASPDRPAASLRPRRGRLAPAVLALVLVLGGCASDGGEPEFVDRDPGAIYNTALDEFSVGNYNQAVVEFNEVERQHPYSQWATKSKLMAAYTLYLENKYQLAIDQLEAFIQLHPGNEDIAYAYYLRALSYYEQISDVERDQGMTQRAFEALNEVVRRFPDTKYGKDAKGKAVLARDHLAGKEIEIGRYYQRKTDYLAAINRFKTVLADYDGTSHVPEALHRLTECYLSLGLLEEARRSAAVLGYNFPDSEWYRDSYALLNEDYQRPPTPEDLERQNQDFFDQTWQSLF